MIDLCQMVMIHARATVARLTTRIDDTDEFRRIQVLLNRVGWMQRFIQPEETRVSTTASWLVEQYVSLTLLNPFRNSR